MAIPREVSMAEWESHKPAVCKLYVDEALTLAQVMDQMASRYSFHASGAQYKRKLKAWGFQKNQKGEFWKDISLTLKRKNLDPTNVDVLLHGKLVPTKKLKNKISRYDLPTLKLNPSLPASSTRDTILPATWRAQTPEGVLIRPKTQIPRSLRIELPWHELRAQLDRVIPYLFPTEANRSPTPLPSSYLDTTEDTTEWWIYQHSLFGQSHGSIIDARHNDFVGDKIASVLNVSPLAARHESLIVIVTLMAPYVPEKYEKETLNSACQLIDPGSSKRMQVLISFMALLLANDVLSDERLDAFVGFLDEIAGKQAFGMLPLRDEPSTKAIITQLLFAAVRKDVPRLIQSALENNVNINRQSTGGESTTLILEAIRLERLHIIQLLIDAAADLQPIRLGGTEYHSIMCRVPRHGRSASEVYGMPRFYCFCERSSFVRRTVCGRAASTRIANEVLPLLLHASGTIGPGPVTTLAISFGGSTHTIEKVLRAGGSVDEYYIPPRSNGIDECAAKSTPLCAAVTSGDARLVGLLLKYGADPNGPIARYTKDFLADWGKYFYKSPLVIATEQDNLQLVQSLLEHGADPNLCPLEVLDRAQKEQCIRKVKDDQDDRGPRIVVLYPLQAAAGLADTHIAEVLLDYGANVNPLHDTPPLSIAAHHAHPKTLDLLLSRGAMTNPSPAKDFWLSPLEGAVISGNEDIVKRLLSAGADPHGCSAWLGGRTPLQRAAENGSTAIFDTLLRAGAALESSFDPNHGATILYWFVMHRNHDRVTQLLCDGVSPTGDPVNRRSPLTAAIFVKDLDMVALLIKWGADPNEPYPMCEDLYSGGQQSILFRFRPKCIPSYRTPKSLGSIPPLQWAVSTGRLDVVASLCSSGADVNGTSMPVDTSLPGLDLTALHLAVAHQFKDIVTYLLARGADINSIANFPAREISTLCISISHSDQEVTELLLRNGADPYVPCRKNHKRPQEDKRIGPNTILPLEYACKRKDKKMVQFLLSSGVDVRVGCPLVEAFGIEWDNAMSFLDGAEYQRVRNRVINTMELLLSHGADVNHRLEGKSTPLQAAILCAASISLTLNAKEGVAEQAMKQAATQSLLHCARRLIELGAEINARPSHRGLGRTALQAAVEVGEVEFVQFLLTKGAEVNAPAAPRVGVTALQAAAIRGFLRIAQILLEHGADVDADPSPVLGRRAIDGAAEWGRIDMVKFLLDNYNGPRSIPDVCASAMECARWNSQWYVMELLEKYEPPAP
ncbi:hypothetical protein A1O7_10022 [Cladophialophora yegresii CBS 114405]|uniref:Clr5 domain-containing protein n=1 Tax=Cladophialophora yegresii CBS 114405 TaxID=1182544 RepID=W9VR89_9EURO|nr:uncharacterized protein A1O7_10022 [Cladophialophora yegresii CBS 114405]EXJ54681.1 hypothetical protein A1O7_10022 [Cladophialophora yegresii CBS 114405]